MIKFIKFENPESIFGISSEKEIELFPFINRNQIHGSIISMCYDGAEIDIEQFTDSFLCQFSDNDLYIVPKIYSTEFINWVYEQEFVIKPTVSTTQSSDKTTIVAYLNIYTKN